MAIKESPHSPQENEQQIHQFMEIIPHLLEEFLEQILQNGEEEANANNGVAWEAAPVQNEDVVIMMACECDHDTDEPTPPDSDVDK